jgi:uncharacterized RDD family membrane protein YckC
MFNDRRRLLAALIFFGLSAPFIALFALKSFAGKGSGPAVGFAQMVAASKPAGNTDVGESGVMAAGDGKELWVMEPVLGENGQRGFQLLRRTADTGVWRAAVRGGAGSGNSPVWSAQSMPGALVMMQTSADRPGASSPYLLGEPQPEAPGWVYRMALDDYHPQALLPAGHTIKAATGSVDQLFVITLGPPVAGATQPGDPLRVDRAQNNVIPPLKSAINLSKNEPNSSPATIPALFNVFWLPPNYVPPFTSATSSAPSMNALHPSSGDWCLLSALGPAADESGAVPSAAAHMALAEKDGRLMVFWVEPTKPGTLVMRVLEYGKKEQQWSAPRAIALKEEVPAVTRLFAVWLDKTLYVLWTAPSEIKDAAGVPVGSSQALHGGWINTDGKAEVEFHGIAAMPLAGAGSGLTPDEVAVGSSENSIVAVVSHDDGMKELVFDSRGKSLGGGPVAPAGPRRDVQIGQNIAMVLLALMLTLSVWQWRQKPVPLTLPAGRMIAPLHLRALAFGLDAVLPYVAVLLITGEWASSGYVGTLRNWLGVLANPEELAQATDLYMFLGIYLGHVMLGELIFHRSLGKMLVGLEIVTLEGKVPTAGAMVVRNLVRVPECVVGVVVLYMMMSERRQRLGDLMARTVVVAEGEGKKG